MVVEAVFETLPEILNAITIERPDGGARSCARSSSTSATTACARSRST